MYDTPRRCRHRKEVSTSPLTVQLMRGGATHDLLPRTHPLPLVDRTPKSCLVSCDLQGPCLGQKEKDRLRPLTARMERLP